MEGKGRIGVHGGPWVMLCLLSKGLLELFHCGSISTTTLFQQRVIMCWQPYGWTVSGCLGQGGCISGPGTGDEAFKPGVVMEMEQ